MPQGLAIPLTQANKRRIEALRQRRAEREAHEFNSMTELGKAVSKLICVVQVKTGEDGKMFGSVTAGAIADQLKHQFEISLDKRKIHLEHPIRTLGEHEVELRLHQEVTVTLKVQVESSTPLPPPPTEAPEAKKEERPDRRGRRPEHRRSETPEKAGAGKPVGDARSRPGRGERPRAERPPRAPRAAKPETPK